MSIDKSFNIVDNYVRSFHTLNKTEFIRICDENIAKDCEVTYNINQSEEDVSLTIDQYKTGMLGHHFDNTTDITVQESKIKLLNESCIKSTDKEHGTNVYKYFTHDYIKVARKGKGLDEDGAGLYDLYSDGFILISDEKIIKIAYIFNKYKID